MRMRRMNTLESTSIGGYGPALSGRRLCWSCSDRRDGDAYQLHVAAASATDCVCVWCPPTHQAVTAVPGGDISVALSRPPTINSCETHARNSSSSDAATFWLSSCQSTASVLFRLFALHLAPAASALRLMKSGTLSLQLFQCVPALTLFVVISRRTVSSRPSNPLSAFILAPQMRLLLSVVHAL